MAAPPALNNSTYVTTGIFLVLTALATLIFKGFRWEIWGASAVGLLVGVIIGLATNYFTDDSAPIVKRVAHASKSGPAFTILSGVSYGFMSVLPAMVGIAVSALVAYKLGAMLAPTPAEMQYAMYGISMAAWACAIVGMIISNDAYSPIVDNAAAGGDGRPGRGDHPRRGRADSAGNTVKAVAGLPSARRTDGHLPGRLHERGQHPIAELNVTLAAAGEADGICQRLHPQPHRLLRHHGGRRHRPSSPPCSPGRGQKRPAHDRGIHRQFKSPAWLTAEGVEPECNKCIDIAAPARSRTIPTTCSPSSPPWWWAASSAAWTPLRLLLGNIISGICWPCSFQAAGLG